MGFLGYETLDKLIWTSGKGCSNTNTTKKRHPKINEHDIPFGNVRLWFLFS